MKTRYEKQEENNIGKIQELIEWTADELAIDGLVVPDEFHDEFMEELAAQVCEYVMHNDGSIDDLDRNEMRETALVIMADWAEVANVKAGQQRDVDAYYCDIASAYYL